MTRTANRYPTVLAATCLSLVLSFASISSAQVVTLANGQTMQGVCWCPCPDCFVCWLLRGLLRSVAVSARCTSNGHASSSLRYLHDNYATHVQEHGSVKTCCAQRDQGCRTTSHPFLLRHVSQDPPHAPSSPAPSAAACRYRTNTRTNVRHGGTLYGPPISRRPSHSASLQGRTQVTSLYLQAQPCL